MYQSNCILIIYFCELFKVFCSKCSSKSSNLPKFGIEREVRVCDSCYDKYGPKDEDAPIQKPVCKY